MYGRPPAPTQAPPPPGAGSTATDAGRVRHLGVVVWIDPDQAFVATKTASGQVSSVIVARPPAVPTVTYLAHVAHLIGDAERVIISGPDAMRTELEREYTAIQHRPDRIIDVEPVDLSTPPAEADLLARLEELA
jgi:hypothetical protein